MKRCDRFVLALSTTLLAASLAMSPPSLARAAAPSVRFMLHGGWGPELPTEEYLRFVEEVRPDIVILGAFDQRLYATASRGEMNGKPAKAKPLPPPGQLLDAWKLVADRLHRSGIRLIGQMEINVVSDRPAELSERTGWFGYYENQWDEALLGKRPTRTAAELLEEPDLHPDVHKPEARDATALCGCRVNLRALNGCINKPEWRAVQKAIVRAALDHGVDGFITNRNYVNHCACDHCREKCRQRLANRYSPADLRERFGIADLAAQRLCMLGSHRDHETVPSELVLEQQRFGKEMVKEFFDEVYVEYGRSQKPDLFVLQWNHMAYFDELHLDRSHLPPSTRTGLAHAAADERWALPIERWGQDESLLWYCNWGTTQNTILDKQFAGDTVLYGKLLRSLSRGRPYTINKYDFYRPRNMMAEAAALGYVTNAIDTPWNMPEDREVVLRYFEFLKKHADVHTGAESLAEIALVFPRRALAWADASPLEYVEAAGRMLIREHILFDVLADDLLASVPLKSYRALVVPAPEYLEEADRQALTKYVANGGRLIFTPVSRQDRDRPGATSVAARERAASASLDIPAATVSDVRLNSAPLHQAIMTAVGPRLSRFEAPWSVEIQAYHRPAAGQVVLHFVNYNHVEKASGKTIVARESPLAAQWVEIVLPVASPGRRMPRMPVKTGFECRESSKSTFFLIVRGVRQA